MNKTHIALDLGTPTQRQPGMATVSLIPVVSGRVGQQSQQLVDARLLHEFLGVRRDFSNWIRTRIEAYGFELNVDYLRIRTATPGSPFGSPIRANQTGRGGDRRSATCFISLNMAKELAMVERTERGRQARRYFIDCERQVQQLQRGDIASRSDRGTSLHRDDLRAINRQAWADVSAEVHAAFHRRREALVHEHTQALTLNLTHPIDAEPQTLPPPSWSK